MRYLSLFSGIEAASVAWHPLGWECVAVAEIEKFPARVLQHYYPGVPNLGDVTKVTESDIMALGQIDLVVFGSPCQDLSVAGKRKGLEGARSGLFFTAINIINWARVWGGCRFALWENVPGAFSSNRGRDFAAVVDALAGLEGTEPPPKRWGTEGCAVGSEAMVEWSTLDAQWFGVAQRRRRVFALADFGDWTRRPPILLESESLRGDSAPRREAGESVAGTLARSVALRGREGGGTAELGGDIAGTIRATGGGGDKPHVLLAQQRPVLKPWPAIVAPTLNASFGDKQGLEDQHALNGAGLFVPVCATGSVTHALKAEGADASEDGAGRGVPIIAFNANAQPDEMRFDPYTSAPLTCSQQSAIAFSCKDFGADASVDVSPTLRAMNHEGSHANAGGQMAVAYGCDTYNGTITGDVAATLSTQSGDGVSAGPSVLTAYAVRRLTPTECERLQGFPDGYTAIPKAADGPRYKALGNSMAVPVMHWIGRQIDFVARWF